MQSENGQPVSPSANLQGSASAKTNVSGDIQAQFAADSPLKLLGIESTNTPPLKDPQRIANEIAVQRELDKIEAQKSTPTNRYGANTPVPKSQEPAPTVTQTPEPKVEEPKKEAVTDGSDLLDDILVDKEEEPALEAEPVSEEDELLADVPVEPKAENFKKLREKVKVTAKTLKEREKELETTRQKLTEYETGAALPEVLKAKDNRIAELEPFEHLINLKSSPEYKERFIKPLNDLGSQLEVIAAEYDLTTDVMNRALSLTKPAELNQFLSEHFDPVGAQDVRQIVQQMQTIQRDALSAEKAPKTALQAMLKQHEELEIQREAERRTKIQSAAKSSWVNAVQRIRKEGVLKALIPREGDSQHTERFVNPLQTAAAQEFGKIVKRLADLGIKDLPQEDAEAFATMCLYAHGSVVAATQAEATARYANELEQNTKKFQPMYRPSMSGGGGTGSIGSPSEHKAAPTPQGEARQQLKDMGLA